jgi:hypothetical protein
MDGRLETLMREEALASLDRVLVLTHWRPHVSEHWVVIWDGSPMHTGHGRPLFAEGGGRQMPREQRPPDAPDLNPGEGVWHPWKNVARRHLCCWNLAPLRSELGRAIKRLRRKPHVMTACVPQAGLSIETQVLHAPFGNRRDFYAEEP